MLQHIIIKDKSIQNTNVNITNMYFIYIYIFDNFDVPKIFPVGNNVKPKL